MSISPEAMAHGLQPTLSHQLNSQIPQGYPQSDQPIPHSSYPPYQGARDQNPLMSPHPHNQPFPYNNRSSISGLSDDQSPNSSHPHRMSFGSAGPFMQSLKPASIGESDPTSPGSLMGAGSAPGDNIGNLSSAHNSNNTVNSQGQDEKSKDYKSDGTPAWAELKTKAGKERKRLPLACIACRRKKIRCSGEKPACKHCLRSRIPCVYKVTTRKAAPRTDYMAMLDKRLKRMEDRVIKIMPKDEQRNLDVIGRAVVKPALPGVPPKPAETKKRVADEAFSEELNEWSKNRQSAQGNSKAKEKEQAKDGLLLEGAEYLPSMELQQHLAEVFFDFVYGQSYHLLHKPSYIRKLDAGQLPPVLVLAVCAMSARFSSHPDVRTEPAFLRGEKWAKPAREIALKRYDTPNTTILIAYLILGLHEFGTCHGGRSWMLGGMAQRMAYALQLHKDLDHDSQGKSSQAKGSSAKGQDELGELTFTDREIRRRTMWACFMMDRFNSSGTDRPLFVSEQYIESQLPIKEHYFQMEITGPTEDLEGRVSRTVEPDTGQVTEAKDNMGCAAYMIRLVAIWGQLVRYMNLGGKERDEYPLWSDQSGFRALKVSIEQWRNTLPTSLHYNHDNLMSHASEKIANQFLFLHIVYNQTVLFMNRFVLPVPGVRPPHLNEMPVEFRNECARSAVEAANQISTLVNEAMDYRVVAPFAGYSAFFSSTVHIHGLSAKNPALEAQSKQYLAWNVKYLSKMKKYWGMFHFVTDHLKDLYRRHADSSARAMQNPSSAGQRSQEGIFQYGDWFDWYPHGVSGTDYEDPLPEIKKEPGSDAVLGQKGDLQSVEEFFAKMSPPSRTGQAKKAPRKKRTKSTGQSTAAPVEAATAQAAQFAQAQSQHQHIHIPHMDQNMLNQNFSQHMAYNQQSGNQSSFPQDMTHDMSLMQGQRNAAQQQQQQQQQQQGIMSHLDRQMVLSSYAGIDAQHSPSDPHGMQNQQQQQQQAFGDLDLGNPFSFNNTGTNWDQTSGWFMPFNVDPPNAMGDDSGLFTAGGYADFAAGLGMQGFGMGGVDLESGGPGGGQGQGDGGLHDGGMLE